MTCFRIVKAASVLGFVALLVFLFLQTQTVDWAAHQRYSSAVLQLQGVNADLNKNILKVRFWLLDYNDTLVSEFGVLRTLQASLADIPASIGPKGQDDLQKPYAILSVMLNEKEEILERFKAQNAVLKNSVRYLPPVLQEARATIQDDVLVGRLEGLVGDVLRFNQDANREWLYEIRDQLKALEVVRDQYRPSPERDALDRTLTHVNTVVSHTPAVNSLTDTLTWMPLEQWSHTLGQTYQRHHAEVVALAERYQLSFYAVALVFVLYILSLLLWPSRPLIVARTGTAVTLKNSPLTEAETMGLRPMNLATLQSQARTRQLKAN